MKRSSTNKILDLTKSEILNLNNRIYTGENMETFDNIIEINNFIKNAKDKNIDIITGKYELTFKLGGKKQDISVIKLILGDFPNNLNEFLNEMANQQKESDKAEQLIPQMSEQETWEKINPCFDISKNGNFKMINAPEWDDMLKERFDAGIYEVSTNGLILSIKTFYNYHINKRICRPIIDRELMCQKFDERMITRRMHELKTLSSAMSYEPQDRDYLKDWLEAMECENVNISLQLFKHWLWLVKRNMFGLEVKYETLLVLRSLSHGIGKSWSIDFLTEPLSKFVIHPGLSSITEERSIALDSANNLILNFDELAGAERTQIESLKKWVTNQNMTYRPMGTNSSTNVRKLASGIGTSNKPIAQFIKDNTGNRRFIELVLNVKDRPELTKTDEYKKGGIAWLSIWKNIDENNNSGYYDPDSNVKQKAFVQNCLSSGDVVTNMFKDIFVWDDLPKHQNIRQQQLYNIYKEYCCQNRQQPVQLENFKVALSTLIDSDKFRITKTFSRNTNWYKLPAVYDYWYEDLKLSNTQMKDIKQFETTNFIEERTDSYLSTFKKEVKHVEFT